jgi:hypothetical protein
MTRQVLVEEEGSCQAFSLFFPAGRTNLAWSAVGFGSGRMTSGCNWLTDTHFDPSDVFMIKLPDKGLQF